MRIKVGGGSYSSLCHDHREKPGLSCANQDSHPSEREQPAIKMMQSHRVNIKCLISCSKHLPSVPVFFDLNFSCNSLTEIVHGKVQINIYSEGRFYMIANLVKMAFKHCLWVI